MSFLKSLFGGGKSSDSVLLFRTEHTWALSKRHGENYIRAHGNEVSPLHVLESTWILWIVDDQSIWAGAYNIIDHFRKDYRPRCAGRCIGNVAV